MYLNATGAGQKARAAALSLSLSLLSSFLARKAIAQDGGAPETMDSAPASSSPTEGDAGPTYDKSHDSLLHPTPDTLLRAIPEDHPDPDPTTVDAGHFQIAIDLASYTLARLRLDGQRTRTETWSFASTLVKVGLFDNVDVELRLPSYTVERERDFTIERRSRREGVGDLTWQLKVNLCGNDGGPFQAAVMPLIKIPTAQHGLGNGSVEGGILVPTDFTLPAGFDVGATANFLFENGSDGRFFVDFAPSVSLNYIVFERMHLFTEIEVSVNTRARSPWTSIVTTGTDFKITPDVQIFAEASIGLTPASDDVSAIAGVSLRY